MSPARPYNVGKRYGDGPAADRMRFTYFHGWLMQVISEIGRTLKPGGVVCLNVGKTVDWQERMLPMDVMLFENLRTAGLTFQDRVIWTSSHGLTPKRKLATFNATPARTPQRNPAKAGKHRGPQSLQVFSVLAHQGRQADHGGP